MSKLNLNSYVKVKLNAKGIDIFERYVKNNLFHKRLNMLSIVDHMHKLYKIENISKGSEVSQIIVTIQLWEFMDMFKGVSRYMGGDTPFDMNIEINDNDLIKEN